MESNTINSTNATQVQNDEISLRELILKIREWCHYLLSSWKFILLAGVLGAVLGLIYAYSKKPLYTATCTFVLDEGKSGGGLSQYAGLAAMAGINIGGGASDGLFQGDNILELYKSRRMLQETLLSYGQFNGKKDLLINRYIEINNLRKRWENNSKLKDLSFNVPAEEFTRINDSVMIAIVSDIRKNYLKVAKLDKKLSIIQVEVKSNDEAFAKNFNDAVVANVNRFYVETKTRKSMDNLRILQRQADSVRSVLNASIGGAASALDANPNANTALQTLRVPSQKKQIDVQANTAMYAEIVKNLEMAKLSTRQDAPLIQVIDNAAYPLEKTVLGKLKGLFLGGTLFGFLSVCFLLIRYFIKGLL